MVKPKRPFLSLEASGSVGGEITAQRVKGQNILRIKPTPIDRMSLAQIYQRWDYQDYIAQWVALSDSAKQEYKTAASRWHTTGLAYFMQGKLKTLPDLAGRWRLDEKGGAIARDSSRNDNHGVIAGASPTGGVIGGGYYFDGIDDRIVIPNSPSLDIIGDLSIECFVKRTILGGTQYVVSKRSDADQQYCLALRTGNLFYFDWYDGGWKATHSIAALTDTTSWHHLVVTRTPTHIIFYIDGVLDVDRPLANTLVSYDVGLALGCTGPLTLHSWYYGYLDNVAIYNRILTPSEVLRHSLRHYP